MGAGDELRGSGGTAGQLKEGHGLGVDVGDRCRLVRAQRCQRGELGGVSGDDHCGRVLQSAGHLAGERAVIEPAVLGGDDIGGGVRETAEVADLGGTVRRQSEHGQRPDAEDREEDFGVFDDVR